MSDAIKTLLRHRHGLDWTKASLIYETANKYAKNTDELESIYKDLVDLFYSLSESLHESIHSVIELRERHPDGSVSKFVVDMNAVLEFVDFNEEAYGHIRDILEAAEGRIPLESVPRCNSFSDSPEWYSEIYTTKSPNLIFEYRVRSEPALDSDEDDVIPF